MKVYIDQQVHWHIEDYYENALLNHTVDSNRKVYHDNN